MKLLIYILIFILVFDGLSCAKNIYYNNSYAIVIGINNYPNYKGGDLFSPVNDAKAVACFLESKGFKVTILCNELATKRNIVSYMEDDLPKDINKNDRFVFFFSGHGAKENDLYNSGYIVPFDGTDKKSSYISSDELKRLSEKPLHRAKHQLFVLDSCFSGFILEKGYDPIITRIKTRARQVICATTKDQLARDGEKNGYSRLTSYFLDGLKKGDADKNYDGYITFSELREYIITNASDSIQTPVAGILPGHEYGDFIFESPVAAIQKSSSNNVLPTSNNKSISSPQDEVNDEVNKAYTFIRIYIKTFEFKSPVTKKDVNFLKSGLSNILNKNGYDTVSNRNLANIFVHGNISISEENVAYSNEDFNRRSKKTTTIVNLEIRDKYDNQIFSESYSGHSFKGMTDSGINVLYKIEKNIFNDKNFLYAVSKKQ